MNKKGQISVITSLVFGIATLIVGIIVAFIVVTNVGTIDDNLYVTLDGPSGTNETVTALAEEGDDLTYYYLSGCSATVSSVFNSSDDDYILAAGNYTVSGCTITGVAESPYLGYDVLVTYTTTYSATVETAELMQSNFTSGIDNISGKVPTVLLIGAIVLILGVLALLFGVWQNMRSGPGI